MRPLSDAGGGSLEWREPQTAERRFELRGGEELFATLAFKSSFGTLATAETASGRWTFKRMGFLNPRVTVRAEGAGGELAVYHPNLWRDGLLSCADGRAYPFRPVNFWASRWAFCSPGGSPLVTFHPGPEKPTLSDLFTSQAMVEVAPSASADPHLPLLVTLGWYLMLLHRDDAGAVAAGAEHT